MQLESFRSRGMQVSSSAWLSNTCHCHTPLVPSFTFQCIRPSLCPAASAVICDSDMTELKADLVRASYRPGLADTSRLLPATTIQNVYVYPSLSLARFRPLTTRLSGERSCEASVSNTEC